MLNNVVLMGRLCAEPEIKYTQSNKAVLSVNIAVDRDYSSNGERKADFIPIVAWEKTAEFIGKYFSKGSMIAVQGRIETRSYEDKNGQKRTVAEVRVDKVSFCGEKKETATPEPTKAAAPVSYDIADDDELPF